ncbi:tetratricopeptide repeat protein [Candidatus Cyanaurora vandensis]|uniref:tetratricopeptide repeat protein n=1 Tax=Candidatus Cyanaurora vandensis TaxID=2714958 RepID=UPI00257D24CB|nr:tetratricopeptide repeat protein [Candidatus Cyanaurora vandensis]
MGDRNGALVYLAALFLLLVWIAWQVFNQVIRTRSYETLISRLQPKLTKGTGTPEEHYELGCAYLEKKLYEEAIRQFKKALALNPQYAEAHNNLGYAYYQQKQIELALRSYRDAVRYKEDYVSALSNLAHVYERKFQSEQALECYDKILQVQPKHTLANRRASLLRKRVPTENKG